MFFYMMARLKIKKQLEKHKRFKMLVLIDNYDSFTWNLVQYFGDLGESAQVFRNDKITVDEVLALKPDSIVLSPGPGTPDDSGICLDMVHAAAKHEIPLFGVCLGHQAIGQAFGGAVGRAPEPVHGKVWEISHTDAGVMAGLPSPLTVTRYHSLIVEADSMPDTLEATAHSAQDGLVMALRHKTLPIHGVQFHPESIASEHGHDMLRNFLELAKAAR